MSKTIYLLQNVSAGYIGNSPLFWKEGGGGYTQSVDEAKRFTPDEASKVVRSTKGTHRWKRWHVRDVLKATVRVANIDKLLELTKRKVRR